MHEFAGMHEEVPDLTPEPICRALTEYFYDIRRFCDTIDNKMTMAHIEQWQRHSYVVLRRWEREAMFVMDAALRRGYSSAVKFHAKRSKVNG